MRETITIIPKSKPRMPLLINIIFWLFLLLPVILAIAFFLARGEISTLKIKKVKIEQELTDTLSSKQLAGELFKTSQQIKEFKELLKEHTASSGFLKFLESSIHPQVWFTSLKVNRKQLQAVLTGQSDNFQKLAEQILILEKQEAVKNIKVTNASLSKEGSVDFVLTLSFSRELIQQ